MTKPKIKLFKVTTGYSYKEGYDSNIVAVTVLASDGEEAIKKMKSTMSDKEVIESVILISQVDIQ